MHFSFHLTNQVFSSDLCAGYSLALRVSATPVAVPQLMGLRLVHRHQAIDQHLLMTLRFQAALLQILAQLRRASRVELLSPEDAHRLFTPMGEPLRWIGGLAGCSRFDVLPLAPHARCLRVRTSHGDAGSLAETCRSLASDRERCAALGDEARSHFEEALAPERRTGALLAIYRSLAGARG